MLHETHKYYQLNSICSKTNLLSTTPGEIKLYIDNISGTIKHQITSKRQRCPYIEEVKSTT